MRKLERSRRREKERREEDSRNRWREKEWKGGEQAQEERRVESLKRVTKQKSMGKEKKNSPNSQKCEN